MNQDDFVPKSIPQRRPARPEEAPTFDPTAPTIHPLFAPEPKVEVNMVRTAPMPTKYDWVPGFRGTRLAPKGSGGFVQLVRPSTFFSLMEGGRLTGTAEEDARTINGLCREFLRAIAVNEHTIKKRLVDALEDIKDKKKSVQDAKAELGMVPEELDLSEEALESEPPAEEEKVVEVLTDGEEVEVEKKEMTEEELDAALNAASESEGDTSKPEDKPEEEPFFDFDGAEPPPKKKRRSQKKKKE